MYHFLLALTLVLAALPFLFASVPLNVDSPVGGGIRILLSKHVVFCDDRIFVDLEFYDEMLFSGFKRYERNDAHDYVILSAAVYPPASPSSSYHYIDSIVTSSR